MEDLAGDGAPPEHGALPRLELVQPRRQQRAQRGRDGELSFRSALACDRQHLLDEERIATGSVGDLLAEPAGHVLREQRVDVLFLERFESKRYRPGSAPLDKLGPGETDEQDRGARRKERDVLDEVEQGLLGPLDIVEDDEERPLPGGRFECLTEGPSDLVCSCHGLLPAEQRVDGGGSRIAKTRQLELLQHLYDRPVGVPLAVGQAAALHDLRVNRGRQLSRETRLPDPRVSDDGHELAATLAPHPLPGIPQRRKLALATDELHPVGALRRFAHADQSVCGNGPQPALHLHRPNPLDLGRLADERERRLTDQHLARLRGLLESLTDRDRIPGDKPVAGGRTGNDLAAVDPDACLHTQVR